MIGSESLRGIIVPIATPLDASEQLDESGMTKLIRHILAGGVHGIFCLGTTGEFARLDTVTTRNVIRAAVEEVGGKVPVFAGVSDCGTGKVLRNMREAENLGVDALVVTLPYYFPVRSEAEQLVYFERIADVASIPIILYNMPATIGADIEMPVVERLSQRSNVLGIKDSSGEIEYLKRLLEIRSRSSLRVLVGDERIASEGLGMGADGVVPSLANIFPRLMVGLFEASRRHETAEAVSLQARINGINDSLNGCTASWLSSLTWKKRALQKMGICDDRVTEPFLRLSGNAEKIIERMLAVGDWQGATR